MLRHACGFTLANDGQDTRAIQVYLGHANIAHTARYMVHRAEPDAVQELLAGLAPMVRAPLPSDLSRPKQSAERESRRGDA